MFTPVTHLFLAIYRGVDFIYNDWLGAPLVALGWFLGNPISWFLGTLGGSTETEMDSDEEQQRRAQAFYKMVWSHLCAGSQINVFFLHLSYIL